MMQFHLLLLYQCRLWGVPCWKKMPLWNQILCIRECDVKPHCHGFAQTHIYFRIEPEATLQGSLGYSPQFYVGTIQKYQKNLNTHQCDIKLANKPQTTSRKYILQSATRCFGLPFGCSHGVQLYIVLKVKCVSALHTQNRHGTACVNINGCIYLFLYFCFVLLFQDIVV